MNARSKEQLHIDIPCDGLRAAWQVMQYPSCGMREVKEEAQVVIDDFGIGMEAFLHPAEGGPPLCVMEMTKLKAEVKKQRPGLWSPARRTGALRERWSFQFVGNLLSVLTTRTGKDFLGCTVVAVLFFVMKSTVLHLTVIVSKLRSKSIDYRIEVDPVFDDVF